MERESGPSFGRLEGLQVGDGLRGPGGGGEDCLRVVLQDLQPVGEVLRVIGTRVLSDGELSAEECGPNFGDLS